MEFNSEVTDRSMYKQIGQLIFSMIIPLMIISLRFIKLEINTTKKEQKSTWLKKKKKRSHNMYKLCTKPIVQCQRQI